MRPAAAHSGRRHPSQQALPPPNRPRYQLQQGHTCFALCKLWSKTTSLTFQAFSTPVSFLFQSPPSASAQSPFGEFWYRLAALCILAACPDTGHCLAVLQVAVGVSGESQAVCHALCTGIAADPGCVTMQGD
jgi:hypothetical protein